jgi:hypothetical protein
MIAPAVDPSAIRRSSHRNWRGWEHETVTRTARKQTPPTVDTKEMLERKRLEAELFSVDSHLRQFGRLRETLTAADQDPAAYHRKLDTRRLELLAGLRALPRRPEPADPKARRWATPGLELPLSALPIAAAEFDRVHGVFGFGTSGEVQVAPAAENTDTFVKAGPWPASGTIETIPGAQPGAVKFDGTLDVGPEQVDPARYDPTINYYWIHNWKYLVPFPAPTVLSRLTYRFEAYCFQGLFFSGGEGNVSSFVSLGETSNLTMGTNIAVNIDGGWPLPTADLRSPALHYNGSYGYIDGAATVQRSFMVGAGHVPAVAIVVGLIASLSMMASVNLSFPGLGDSAITIASTGGLGRIAYSYEPELVMSPD